MTFASLEEFHRSVTDFFNTPGAIEKVLRLGEQYLDTLGSESKGVYAVFSAGLRLLGYSLADDPERKEYYILFLVLDRNGEFPLPKRYMTSWDSSLRIWACHEKKIIEVLTQ